MSEETSAAVVQCMKINSNLDLKIQIWKFTLSGFVDQIRSIFRGIISQLYAVGEIVVEWSCLKLNLSSTQLKLHLLQLLNVACCDCDEDDAKDKHESTQFTNMIIVVICNYISYYLRICKWLIIYFNLELQPSPEIIASLPIMLHNLTK